MQLNQLEYEAVDKAALEAEVRLVVETAQELVIDSDDMQEVASDELRGVKTRIKELTAKRDQVRNPIKQALDEVNALFKEPLDRLAGAESTIKDAIGVYLDKKEAEAERIRAEQRRIEQEAQRKAAEEARRIAAEAEAERRKAAEAETMDEQRKAEEKATELDVQARTVEQQGQFLAATAVVPVVPVTPKTEGVSSKFLYSGECVDILALARFIIDNPQYQNLITANKTAINGLARSQKDAFKVPGCKLIKKRSIAAQGR